MLIAGVKDRFRSHNNLLKVQKWSLTPVIITLIIFLSDYIIKVFWSQIPILKKYEYTPFAWDVVAFFFFLLILFFVFLYLHSIYNISLIEAFNLKLSEVPFILKICAVLTVINISSIYFIDFNLLLNVQGADLEMLKSMDMKRLTLFFLVTVIIAPLVEEIIFRGLVYSPLYRKVGRHIAIVISSLLWTHVHFFPLLPSLSLFIVGIFLGWLYDRSGSLIHPIVFHMFKNCWILIYFFT